MARPSATTDSIRGDDAAPAVGRGRSGVAVAELHCSSTRRRSCARRRGQPFLAGLRAAWLFEVFINEHLEMSEGERDASPFERLLNSAEWEMEMQGWAGGAPAFVGRPRSKRFGSRAASSRRRRARHARERAAPPLRPRASARRARRRRRGEDGQRARAGERRRRPRERPRGAGLAALGQGEGGGGDREGEGGGDRRGRRRPRRQRRRLQRRRGNGNGGGGGGGGRPAGPSRARMVSRIEWSGSSRRRRPRRRS